MAHDAQEIDDLGSCWRTIAMFAPAKAFECVIRPVEEDPIISLERFPDGAPDDSWRQIIPPDHESADAVPESAHLLYVKTVGYRRVLPGFVVDGEVVEDIYV
jgi:hypothetical protein